MVNFQNLDFGTKPSTVSLDRVTVDINADLMIGDFASALCKEAQRRNVLKFEQLKNVLTPENVENYLLGLLAIRVESLKGQSANWRTAKMLWIPAWIQFVLSQVGTVHDRNRGLVMEIGELKHHGKLVTSYSMDKLLQVSDALAAFVSDGMALVRDAMPRNEDGDQEVMTMALIDGYVCGQRVDSHPIAAYVAGFLAFKLQKEAEFKMLYRVRYEEEDFIRTYLLHGGDIVGQR